MSAYKCAICGKELLFLDFWIPKEMVFLNKKTRLCICGKCQKTEQLMALVNEVYYFACWGTICTIQTEFGKKEINIEKQEKFQIQNDYY